jgi:hypothetical protein
MIAEYLIATLSKEVKRKIGKYASYAAAIACGFCLSYSATSWQLETKNDADVVDARSIAESNPVNDCSEMVQVAENHTSQDGGTDADRDIVRAINGDIISEIPSVGLLTVLNPIRTIYSKYDHIKRVFRSTRIKGVAHILKTPSSCDEDLIGHEHGRYIDTG